MPLQHSHNISMPVLCLLHPHVWSLPLQRSIFACRGSGGHELVFWHSVSVIDLVSIIIAQGVLLSVANF